MNSHFIGRDHSDPQVFYDLLRALSKETELIKIQEACDMLHRRVKTCDKLVAFTFDDGFEECSTMIAPALEAFGVNAAFFVNPNFVDGDELYQRYFAENILRTQGKTPMDWRQILTLAERNHVIGCHTFDHLRCNITNREILFDQIVNCKRYIELKLGRDCDYFAYPFGRLSDLSDTALEIASSEFDFIFSGHSSRSYFSRNGRVINRRHIEGDWPISHVRYFVSFSKYY